MNKKFLAILALLSVIPGCWWGPRYQCNTPCAEPRTTCVEATDCLQEGSTTCHEEYPASGVENEEYCYEAEPQSDNVEYCYEATDYPEFDEAQYPSEEYGYENQSGANQEFEEFDYDEFDQV